MIILPILTTSRMDYIFFFKRLGWRMYFLNLGDFGVSTKSGSVLSSQILMTVASDSRVLRRKDSREKRGKGCVFSCWRADVSERPTCSDTSNKVNTHFSVRSIHKPITLVRANPCCDSFPIFFPTSLSVLVPDSAKQNVGYRWAFWRFYESLRASL